MILYLDGCCLNRPFDDKTQLRIRRESDAIVEILCLGSLKGWIRLGSDILLYEIEQNRDEKRRIDVLKLYEGSNPVIPLDEAIINRGTELEK